MNADKDRGKRTEDRGQKSEVRDQRSASPPFYLRPSALSAVNSSAAKLRGVRAFTLIEMLVVIGIIGLLAAMVIALFPRFADLKIRSRIKGEMGQLETAINSYNSKRGFYPPDNPKNP